METKENATAISRTDAGTRSKLRAQFTTQPLLSGNHLLKIEKLSVYPTASLRVQMITVTHQKHEGVNLPV